MVKLLRLRRCLVALAIGAATVGCGEPSGDISVQGQVNYKGKPFPGGIITFFPASGRQIQAIVASDGAYEANLPPGEYRVALSLSVDLPPGWKEGDPMPPPPIKLPTKYTKRVETPLTASVSAENSSQTIDFNLD
jgi:hypothetical protein